MDNTGVPSHSPLESSIDKSPYLNIMEDGLITAVRNDLSENDEATTSFAAQKAHHLKPDGNNDALRERNEDGTNVSAPQVHETALTSGQNAHEERLSRDDHSSEEIHESAFTTGWEIDVVTHLCCHCSNLAPSFASSSERSRRESPSSSEAW